MNDFELIHTKLAKFPKILKLFRVTLCPINQLQGRVVVAGMPNCYPLAKYDEHTYLSLRASPILAEPTVAISDVIARESMQIATSIRSLVPVLFVFSLFDSTLEQWKNMRDNTDGVLEKMVDIDGELGGSTTIGNYLKLLNNEIWMNAFCTDSGGKFRVSMLVDAIETVSPEELRTQFQRKVIESLTTRSTDYYQFDSVSWLEPFRIAMGTLGFVDDPYELSKIRFKCVQGAANQDNEWVTRTGRYIEYKSAYSQNCSQLISAGSVHEQNLLEPSDPYYTCVSAMVSERENYTGQSHVKLMEALIESEQYELAWNASLTAGFWLSKSMGSIPRELLSIQAKLASEEFPETLWPIVKRNLMELGIDLKNL